MRRGTHTRFDTRKCIFIKGSMQRQKHTQQEDLVEEAGSEKRSREGIKTTAKTRTKNNSENIIVLAVSVGVQPTETRW